MEDQVQQQAGRVDRIGAGRVRELGRAGNLTLHNNCLSIIVRGDRETMHTLVIPKQYEVFFDNYNKVIGLKNIKSKELYRLGESLQFSGIAFDDEKMKLGEKLPDYCPPRFALPGSIEKLKK